MRCQICYRREATTTTIEFHKRIQVCLKCKHLQVNKETEVQRRRSEAEAEFNAELGAGVYDLP